MTTDPEFVAREILDAIAAQAEELLTFMSTVDADISYIADDPDLRSVVLAGAKIGSSAALKVLSDRGMLAPAGWTR